MEIFQNIPEWVTATITALWFASEALSYIPSVKANGVFQAVHNGLKRIVGK